MEYRVFLIVVLIGSLVLSGCFGNESRDEGNIEPGDLNIYNRENVNRSLHVEILENESVLFEENYTLAPDSNIEVQNVINETGIYNVTVKSGETTSQGVWEARSCNHHLEIHISDSIAVGTLVVDTSGGCS